MKPQKASGPMSVDSAREAAAAALARVLDDGAWGAPALSSVLDSSALADRDKAFATELFYGALRFAGPLELSLLRGADKPGKGLDARIRPHLIVAAYQLQHMQERVPAHAVVDAAVNAVKRARPGLDGFTNALLRRLGSSLNDLLKPDASLTDIALAWGIPQNLAEAVTARLPKDEHAAAIAGLSDRAAVWAASFVAASSVEGEAEPRKHRFVPGLIEVPGGRASNLKGYADGGYVIADPSTVVVVAAVTAAPGFSAPGPLGPRPTVIDLCAAPGIRSVLLQRAGARVIAVELSPRRAKKIGDLCRREHIACGPGKDVDIVVADATALGAAPGDTAPAPADAVLLDAPGTSLGATRRKPEIKLRRSHDDVVEAARLQAKLLAAAAPLVKPGGVLVYSVCSPLDAEGSHQIEAFLAGHPEFSRESLQLLPWLPADAVDELGQVRLLPHRHDADACYIARLRRSTAALEPR